MFKLNAALAVATKNRDYTDMLKQYLTFITLLLSVIFSPVTPAKEERQNTTPTFAYYTLDPILTTNIFTKGATLKYLQVQIDFMVADSRYIAELEAHKPLIRSTIVEHIGLKTEQQLNTLTGKEELRKQLIEILNNLLIAETGKALITDILFTKYLCQ